MRELIEEITRSLVDYPEDVKVTETRVNDNVTIEIVVNPSDMGKVIGKQGKIAKAIRTVAKAAGTKENLYVQVDIVD
ncbi:MAG: KH domain-containing protein [Tissierellia bacterium]|nr:KH domain-containing protein [Tissierellia bacterium]